MLTRTMKQTISTMVSLCMLLGMRGMPVYAQDDTIMPLSAYTGNDGQNMDQRASYPASYDLENIISVGNLSYGGRTAGMPMGYYGGMPGFGMPNSIDRWLEEILNYMRKFR